jgi:hypothetical protein
VAEQDEERAPDTSEARETGETGESSETREPDETRENDETDEADNEAGEPDETGESSDGPSMGKIAGGAAVFLVLALYFVWIGNEMGSHAVSGSFEMWAIFGAIFIGVVALIAGGASMRRR